MTQYEQRIEELKRQARIRNIPEKALLYIVKQHTIDIIKEDIARLEKELKLLNNLKPKTDFEREYVVGRIDSNTLELQQKKRTIKSINRIEI